jgi:hypothetical protein
MSVPKAAYRGGWQALATFWWVAFAVFFGLIIYSRYGPNEHDLRRERIRKRAFELYEAAVALRRENEFPDAAKFANSVWLQLEEQFDDRFPPLGVAGGSILIAEALYKKEGLDILPEPPPDGTELDYARYLDETSYLVGIIDDPRTIEAMRDAVVDAVMAFSRFLPPAAMGSLAHMVGSGSRFTVDILETMEDAPKAVQYLMAPFYAQELIDRGLFPVLRNQLAANAIEASGGSPQKLRMPLDHGGSAQQIVTAYLKQTGFAQLFAADMQFDLPESARFEHHWIVAGSGHGKSQTLQYLIANDLDRVAKGEGSVVVIDSQGDLIRNIAGLKLFAEGEPLHGKLCLIDPTDIEYPVALNLFDVGMERIGGYGELDRERLMNGILELYDFVLGSLLSAELTQKQAVIFRYITRLMLHIPDATIHTFRELMEPKGYEKYKVHIDKLDGTARAFFETEFNSKQFEDTKRQVVRRLWGILENRTFERMFSHPKNKLDLFSEMNQGKVILINTAKELLKQNGTEIFGRFFIALIAQAAQERAALPKEKRLPTFVYVDECADYLDQNVSVILEQARKFNVGMILAHQYVGQLSAKLQESFAANTSIKFAGGVSDRDARQLASLLRSTPDFIERQTKGHFAASVRNLTTSAVSLTVPFGHLEAMPRMTEEEFGQVRSEMRERYAVHWKEIGRQEIKPDEKSASGEEHPSSIDAGPASTAPAADW